MFALHVRNHFAGKIDRAEKVGVHGLSPFFDAGGKKTFCGRASGIGHANVDAAEFRNHCINKTMHSLCVSHVQSLRKNFGGVLFFNAIRGRLQSLSVAGAHGDSASLGGECFCRRPANPLAGRGYDCYPVL